MRRRHFWGSSVQNTSVEGFEDSTLRRVWCLLHGPRSGKRLSPRSWQVGTAGHPCAQTCDYELWLLISVPQTDRGTKASEDTHVNGSASVQHSGPGTAAGRGAGAQGLLGGSQSCVTSVTACLSPSASLGGKPNSRRTSTPTRPTDGHGGYPQNTPFAT